MGKSKQAREGMRKHAVNVQIDGQVKVGEREIRAEEKVVDF